MNTSRQPQDLVLVVDIANVMGSRPDGWWRDRAAAATRLLTGLEPLAGAEVLLPDGLETVRIAEVRAVVEGEAKRADGPPGVSVLRAERDGDSEIVDEAIDTTRLAQQPAARALAVNHRRRTAKIQIDRHDRRLLQLLRAPDESRNVVPDHLCDDRAARRIFGDGTKDTFFEI